VYKLNSKDAYAFFLELGPLKNTLKPEYFGNSNGYLKSTCNMIRMMSIGNPGTFDVISKMSNPQSWLQEVYLMQKICLAHWKLIKPLSNKIR
jgi:hypothetical protein